MTGKKTSFGALLKKKNANSCSVKCMNMSIISDETKRKDFNKNSEKLEIDSEKKGKRNM